MATYNASIDLPPTTQAPRAARRLLHETLAAWQWGDDERRAEAVLLASEIVTNAIDHVDGEASLQFEVTRSDGWLRVSVADKSSVQPILRELSHTERRGRGIALVAAISQRWGSEDHAGGKRVWFELDGAPRLDPGDMAD